MPQREATITIELNQRQDYRVGVDELKAHVNTLWDSLFEFARRSLYPQVELTDIKRQEMKVVYRALPNVMPLSYSTNESEDLWKHESSCSFYFHEALFEVTCTETMKVSDDCSLRIKKDDVYDILNNLGMTFRPAVGIELTYSKDEFEHLQESDDEEEDDNDDPEDQAFLGLQVQAAIQQLSQPEMLDEERRDGGA